MFDETISVAVKQAWSVIVKRTHEDHYANSLLQLLLFSNGGVFKGLSLCDMASNV